MSALDEVAKLKAGRRAELAAAEAELQRRAEEQRNASNAAFEGAVKAFLAGSEIGWLERYISHVASGEAELASVHFALPGHREIYTSFRRIGLAPPVWAHLPTVSHRAHAWTAIDARNNHPQFDLLSDALIAAEIQGWVPPEPQRGLSPEAEQAARAAWAALIQTHEPLPPALAIDMVQETGTDRDDAVSAIHAAAVESLESRRPDKAYPTTYKRTWPHDHPCPSLVLALQLQSAILGESYTLANSCRLAIEGGNREAEAAINHEYTHEGIAERHRDELTVAHCWLSWCADAASAITNCRAVAEAAYPCAVAAEATAHQEGK